jgi:hypothetical protein
MGSGNFMFCEKVGVKKTTKQREFTMKFMKYTKTITLLALLSSQVSFGQSEERYFDEDEYEFDDRVLAINGATDILETYKRVSAYARNDNQNSLLVGVVCANSIFAEWSEAFISILQKTSDLDLESIKVVRELVEANKTNNKNMKGYPIVLGPAVVQKVYNTLDQERRANRFLKAAKDQGLTLDNPKVQVMEDSIKQCVKADFIAKAAPTESAAYYAQSVTYTVTSDSVISLGFFGGLGGGLDIGTAPITETKTSTRSRFLMTALLIR